MSLNNGSAAIHINNKSRQEIALAMDETERVVVGANES